MPKKGFIALNTADIPWEMDTKWLTLPPGVEVKILNEDPELRRVDMMVRFPPGYVEPRHTHESYHCICVLEGTMKVAGKTLKRGDYVFGWDQPHGPYEYPDGCTAFVVFQQGSTAHIY
jgi:anti-sigma factor ChrR (cupin superfamily)